MVTEFARHNIACLAASRSLGPSSGAMTVLKAIVRAEDLRIPNTLSDLVVSRTK